MQIAEDCVQFVLSQTEALTAIKDLHEASNGAYGFATIFIDLNMSSSKALKRIVDDIEETARTNNVGGIPKLAILSSDIHDASNMERLEAIGVAILKKPLSM